MPFIRLHRTHPNFFLVLCGEVVAAATVGISWIADPARWAGSDAFGPARDVSPWEGMRFWGVGFLLVASMIVAGLVGTWRWVQRGLILGAVLWMLGATAFMVALLQGRSVGSSGPAWWLVLAIQAIAQVGEPPSNPARGRP